MQVLTIEMESLRKSDIKRVLPELCKRFRLIGSQPIGEPSGFGVVWKAWDTWLDRDVAIKISKSELRDEILLCRDIEGKTVRIFDYFRDESGWNAYAMELLQAPWISLFSFVNEHKYKSKDLQHYFDCFEIAYQILQGLKDIHGRPYSRQGRYVHADVKPANLFLYCKPKKHQNSVFRMPRHDELVKIIDMGISIERWGFNPCSTTEYDYPKRNDSRPGNDLYALGIVFMEMLGGERPEHETMNRRSRIKAIVRESSSGSRYIDELAVDLIHECVRNANGSANKTGKLLKLLDDRLFDLEPDYLLAIRAINKKHPNGLNKSDLAEFLFDELSMHYGWINKTDSRIIALELFVRDMYGKDILVRDGHTYSVG